MSKIRSGEKLLMYLAVSKVAISGVLMCSEEGIELLVYYVSKALLEVETCYSKAEKICLALIMTAKK